MCLALRNCDFDVPADLLLVRLFLHAPVPRYREGQPLSEPLGNFATTSDSRMPSTTLNPESRLLA